MIPHGCLAATQPARAADLARADTGSATLRPSFGRPTDARRLSQPPVWVRAATSLLSPARL